MDAEIRDAGAGAGAGKQSDGKLKAKWKHLKTVYGKWAVPLIILILLASSSVLLFQGMRELLKNLIIGVATLLLKPLLEKLGIGGSSKEGT